MHNIDNMDTTRVCIQFAYVCILVGARTRVDYYLLRSIILTTTCMSTLEYAYCRVLISSMHTLASSSMRTTRVVSIQCMNIMDINTTTY